MHAAEELAAQLKARANVTEAAWWGRWEDRQYEGALAGHPINNPISAEIEYLLSRNAKRVLDAETADARGAQMIYDALVADFRAFILKTAMPYAVGEQRDLIEAGDFVEAEAEA